MRRLSAQYIFTNTGKPLRRGIVTLDAEDRVVALEDTRGDLRESASVEFHNGIIIPGFVNCHCHLELSHMEKPAGEAPGLASFITDISLRRLSEESIRQNAIVRADRMMKDEGIVLCADICNTPDSFSIKKHSQIKYISLLEVFGVNPDKAAGRMNEVLKLAAEATREGIPWSIVPHSAYSVSKTLFSLIREQTTDNTITSIHFMESESEITFLENHSGPLMDSYRKAGFPGEVPESADSHISVILEEIIPSGNLILVHNTFIREEMIPEVNSRHGVSWCLCPRSNLIIEGKLPPLDILARSGCNIVIGTDSLASNTSLSILDELKTLQSGFPSFSLEDLVRYATLNGARALNETASLGSIEPGKKPGLLLLENCDLSELRLRPDTTVRRLA